MSRNYIFHVEHDFVPVVVIDSDAGAAYVKLSESPVSSTLNLKEGEVMANLDLDAGQRIVGLEVVGTHEFNLARLIEISGIGEYFTKDIIDRAQYVRSDTPPKLEPVSADIPKADE